MLEVRIYTAGWHIHGKTAMTSIAPHIANDPPRMNGLYVVMLFLCLSPYIGWRRTILPAERMIEIG